MTQRALHLRGLAITAVVAIALTQPATGAQTPQTSRPMKIGFIGSGNIGGAIGELLARAGHEVLFSSRNPDGLKPLLARVGPRARAGTPKLHVIERAKSLRESPAHCASGFMCYYKVDQ